MPFIIVLVIFTELINILFSIYFKIDLNYFYSFIIWLTLLSLILYIEDRIHFKKYWKEININTPDWKCSLYSIDKLYIYYTFPKIWSLRPNNETIKIKVKWVDKDNFYIIFWEWGTDKKNLFICWTKVEWIFDFESITTAFDKNTMFWRQYKIKDKYWEIIIERNKRVFID